MGGTVVDKQKLREMIARMICVENNWPPDAWGKSDDITWSEAFGRGGIPDWPNDIAAAFELENGIPEDQRHEYAEILGGIVGRIATERVDTVLVMVSPWNLAHATAEQRCYAWLRWKTVHKTT